MASWRKSWTATPHVRCRTDSCCELLHSGKCGVAVFAASGFASALALATSWSQLRKHHLSVCLNDAL